MSHLSLGRRGYVVKKENLTEQDIKKIERDLTFQPIINQAFKDLAKPKKFCTYLESKLRYYLPRYYGIANFGPPVENKLVTSGQDVDFKVFWGLKDHQLNAWKKLEEAFIDKKAGGVLCLPCGYGKCVAKNTPIMLYNGTFKMSQDIIPGDLLMGDDSTPRTVMTTCTGQEMMYKVTPNKGDPYVVNESHILSLVFSSDYGFKGKKYKKGDVIDLPLKEFINLAPWWHTRAGLLRGYRVPVVFPEKEVTIDPWIIGHWLGDGFSKGPMFSSADQEVIDFYGSYFKKHGLTVKHCSNYDYLVTNGIQLSDKSWTHNDNSKNFLNQQLTKYNLINNKHIPADFKYNTRKVQLAVLAGIIDSDGHQTGGGYDIIFKNERLLDDVIYLARSLGFAAYKSECNKTCTNSASVHAIRENPDDKFGRVTGTYYRTNIHGEGLEEIPVKIAYKKANVRKQIKNALVTKIVVEKLEVDDYFGFTLDGNGRFLLGDFQVTHNTFISIKLGEALKKKMLVLVNKEVLLRQWREAIEKCSNASVGIIQRDKIDVKDRDIVIAMLHSVSMKDYPDNLFDDFGYCVIDECHHISSETFSKALPKVACQYTLGLSATPIRKDGLTEVFLNYLGPIIHKERRTNTCQVWIKYLEIDSSSEAFDTEIMQWTGTKDTGKMTTNIAGFESVNRLVIEICRIMVQSPNFNRKILVLGSRREQLEWLNATWKSEAYDNYAGRIATGGLYYGNIRMNKKEYWNMLEESAKCDVIWGTSEIAKEGLDIPDLNTLIMLNGGSDVEQAVGRILRKYHETTPPTVIDMVYKCGNFQRHANVRRDYYESEEYTLQKATITIDDDPNSIYQSTALLETYLNSYPPENDKSILKRKAKSKKNTEIPLGNHPTQLNSIAVGSIDDGISGVNGISKINGSKSKSELKSIPVEKITTAKKPVEGKWEGEFDSDDERELIEHGLENGHLCFLDSDDERITKINHNLHDNLSNGDNLTNMNNNGDNVNNNGDNGSHNGDNVNNNGDNVNNNGDNNGDNLSNGDTKIGAKVKIKVEGVKIAPKVKFISANANKNNAISISSEVVIKSKPAIAVSDTFVPIVRSGGIKRGIKSIPIL